DVDPARIDLDPAALEAASERARGVGAYAMLVKHATAIQLKRLYSGNDEILIHSMPTPADFFARPVAAMAVGIAMAEGRITSLDSPIAKLLPEWEGEARGT